MFSQKRNLILHPGQCFFLNQFLGKSFEIKECAQDGDLRIVPAAVVVGGIDFLPDERAAQNPEQIVFEPGTEFREICRGPLLIFRKRRDRLDQLAERMEIDDSTTVFPLSSRCNLCVFQMRTHTGFRSNKPGFQPSSRLFEKTDVAGKISRRDHHGRFAAKRHPADDVAYFEIRVDASVSIDPRAIGIVGVGKGIFGDA